MSNEYKIGDFVEDSKSGIRGVVVTPEIEGKIEVKIVEKNDLQQLVTIGLTLEALELAEPTESERAQLGELLETS